MQLHQKCNRVNIHVGMKNWISGNEENERYSSSPNSIMFRILRSYYRALSKHYGGYLSEYPGDENIARLKAYAEQEYKHLVSESRKLHPEVSDEKDVNAKANDDFRDVIHDLVLLWKDRGETISVGGQTILVEGVYNVDSQKDTKNMQGQWKHWGFIK